MDPGLLNTGWAILQSNSFGNITAIASGTIKTDVSEAISDRVGYIAKEISRVINTYAPSIVGIEEIFVNRNPKSSIKLSHARGAVLAACAHSSLEVREFSPLKIKKTITGVGKADKKQVDYMVKLLIKNANPKSEHESDAYAIGYTVIIHR